MVTDAQVAKGTEYYTETDDEDTYYDGEECTEVCTVYAP